VSKTILLAGVRMLGQVLLALGLIYRLFALSRPRGRRWLWWDWPLLAGLFSWLLTRGVLTLFYVPSASMAPTLEVRDGIAVSRLSYYFRRPQVGEVVVFSLTQGPLAGQDLVKRVVAQGGDRIAARQGVFYRNGQAQGPASPDFAERSVREGCFFLMGDNRSQSLDSRAFGEVSASQFYGPVVFRYWPPQRWGRL